MADGVLNGEVAVVTGGAGGIGAAVAATLAREGARVAVADLDGDRARELASELEGDHLGISLDVRSMTSIRSRKGAGIVSSRFAVVMKKTRLRSNGTSR